MVLQDVKTAIDLSNRHGIYFIIRVEVIPRLLFTFILMGTLMGLGSIIGTM
ncbi:hypothetical protein [Paenibacillus stellifer]|uniref:hypothetical protein n=1 Tax=Paenibacillus stellifer TaxID=169760 RepID=UPI0014706436|nr:hypothetical protein [Paenibacillus stellifer]